MALGSVLALLVVAAAAIEGPKLMRGGATDAQGVPASTATPAIPTSVPAPAATQEPAPAPQATVQSTPAPTPLPTTPAPAVPVQVPRSNQQPVPAQYAFRPAQAPPMQTAQAPPPIFQAAPPTGQAAPPASPPPSGTPVTAATATPEMKELRTRINQVAIRAAAAQAGVRSIEQGVQAQGLGLRGDIKAASIRLDYVLQEARTSLQNGDVEGARNNLQYAEGTLQKIEKFLGQ